MLGRIYLSRSYIDISIFNYCWIYVVQLTPECEGHCATMSNHMSYYNRRPTSLLMHVILHIIIFWDPMCYECPSVLMQWRWNHLILNNQNLSKRFLYKVSTLITLNISSIPNSPNYNSKVIEPNAHCLLFYLTWSSLNWASNYQNKCSSKL